VAWRQGESLRVAYDASEALSREIPVWRFHPVRHPAGVTVGWGALYGAAYLAVAGLLLWDPWGWLDSWWGKAMLVTALLFAAVLLLVLPLVLPWRAKRRIERAEERYVYAQLRLGRGAGVVDTRGLRLTRRGRRLASEIGQSIRSEPSAGETVQHANRQRLLRDLVERGQAYRFLVGTSATTAEEWYPSQWGSADATTTVTYRSAE
jgi:hypothetical protein